MNKHVFITLGSNIQPQIYLPLAVQRLAGYVTIRSMSRVYESAPVMADGTVNPDQGPFLNAAVLAATDLPPDVLKYEVLRPLEAGMGRVRSADKFAPRTIDLDIALYGDCVMDQESPRLRLPDPDSLTRAHVALPLADLAPDFVHPTAELRLATIAARLHLAPEMRVREDVALG